MDDKAIRKAKVKITPNFDTILFDLDDTLHDREKTLRAFIRLFLQKYDGNLEPDSRSVFENGFLKMDEQGYRPREEVFTELNKILTWRRAPELKEQLAFWYSEFPKCAEPVSDLYGVLDFFQARNIKMGIVTNGSSAFQNTKIDRLGIRKYMKTIIISEEVNVRKPDPEIFRLALAEIKSKPGTTLFVGDNPVVDIKGALDSGLISVWVSNCRTWSTAQYRPDSTIDGLAGLEDLPVAFQ